MTEKYYILEANCETKEVIKREMTQEESEGYLSMIAAAEEFKLKAEEEAAQSDALKSAALAKLTALGLTPEEAAAL